MLSLVMRMRGDMATDDLEMLSQWYYFKPFTELSDAQAEKIYDLRDELDEGIAQDDRITQLINPSLYERIAQNDQQKDLQDAQSQYRREL